jgi:hypothetical protein
MDGISLEEIETTVMLLDESGYIPKDIMSMFYLMGNIPKRDELTQLEQCAILLKISSVLTGKTIEELYNASLTSDDTIRSEDLLQSVTMGFRKRHNETTRDRQLMFENKLREYQFGLYISSSEEEREEYQWRIKIITRAMMTTRRR